ncbi:MAG: type IV pili methyl-accepting chemotaxis transducer N-terminal domain-containing protein [Rubricella sp.]
MKPVLLAAAFAAAFAIPPAWGTTGDITALEVTRKVNIAGRQRMLSQRMAKASCMIAAGVDEGTHYDQLTQAYDLFVRSDDALRYGNADMGLGPEQRRAVMRALERIDTPWAGYSRIVEGVIEEGSIERGEVALVSEASVEVLRLMNMAVNQTARSYGDSLPDVPLALTITIDVAGRQRMLSQRAMKELCLLHVTGDAATYGPMLESTMNVFDLSLTALQEGFADVGVMAAPNEEIAAQLAHVRELWTPIFAEFSEAVAEGSVDFEELSLLAQTSDVLLREMNTAVGMYELD